MQVFLPHPSFAHSVAVLDRARLGKQRLECAQILNTLLLPREDEETTRAWENHPAVRMWRGHEAALGVYFVLCVREWTARGYRSFMDLPYCQLTLERQAEHAHAAHMAERGHDAAPPAWLGREDVHASHRGRLLDKDPEWYGQFGWTDAPVSEADGYVWPV